MISPYDDQGNYIGSGSASSGLREPTQANRNWMAANETQTSTLPITDIGMQRINQARSEQGLSPVSRDSFGGTIGGLISPSVQQVQSMPQQQIADIRARDVAKAQQRPYRTDQLQQDMVRTNQPIGLPADRVGVPSMSQLMSGIYGGGGFNPYMGGGSMGRGMGRGMGFGGFNPYMGGGNMGFGGFNPYMGGGGTGFGGFNPYMGGGMSRSFNPYMGGGFNPYMAQPQRQPMPMQLPDFARQMYGIGQRTTPYVSMERIMPYVPPRQVGPEFGSITGNV